MRRRTALEDVDFALRQPGAEMVEAPAVAEPELHDDPKDISDFLHRPVEAGALRFKPADGLVEARQFLQRAGHARP